MKKKLSAFTLAEVLIALAIVGIVAALTIPTIMVNLQARKYRVALTKGINSLARAATANYGTEGYDFSGTNGYYGEQDNPIAAFNLAGGVGDGFDVFGFNSMIDPSCEVYSDLSPLTPSLFNIWISNLNLKAQQEVRNYAVTPSDLNLNCASRPTFTTVQITEAGMPELSATIKPDFNAREYWTSSIIQGSGGIFPMCEGRSLANGGINQGRMFMLEDGMVFTYDPAQAYCLETNPCYGYLDINGPEGPNRLISCSEGQDSFITTYGKNALPGMLRGACTVKAKDATDIFPILFYNNNVKPASWAAKSFLYQLSSNQISGNVEENNNESISVVSEP